MKILNNTHRALFILLSTITFLVISATDNESQELHDFDCMVEFSYPHSHMQLVRQEIAHALHFLHEHHEESAIASLEAAQAKLLESRKPMSSEDRDYLQAMLDKINALIDSLEKENNYRSQLLDLCHHLHNRL